MLLKTATYAPSVLVEVRNPSPFTKPFANLLQHNDDEAALELRT